MVASQATVERGVTQQPGSGDMASPPPPLGRITAAMAASEALLWMACAAAFGPRGAASAGSTLALVIAWALCSWVCDAYEPRNARQPLTFIKLLPRIAVLTICVLAAACTVRGDQFDPRGMGLALGLSLTLIMVVRISVALLLCQPAFAERVLVLGGGRLARQLCTELRLRPRGGERVVAVTQDLGVLAELTRRVHADRIIIATTERRGVLPTAKLLDLRMRGVVVEDGINAYERLTGKLAIEALPASHLLFAEGFSTPRAHAILARLLSVVVAGLGTIALAPLFVLIALLIKLDSPGPALFVQSRIGRAGKSFRLLKFRTMLDTAAPSSEWERDNAHRITRVGRVLRRFRLDELLQLVNVVRGDMNLVGPRPHPACNFDLFTARIPYYALRCLVRPGITGWAQVRHGYANGLEEEIEKMRYDLFYIKHASIGLDLRVLCATVAVVLSGQEPAVPLRPDPSATHS